MPSKYTRRLRTLGALALLTALAAVNGPPLIKFLASSYHNWQINSTSYKQRYGHWSILSVPADMRVNAVHTALLYTGKVLIIAGSGNNTGNFNAGRFESLLWDPRTGNFKKITTPSDLFCGGHVFLPDGRLLVAGGTARYEILKVQYAAGELSVTNSSPTHSTTVPKGTIFVSSTGERYRSATATFIPAARKRRAAGGVVIDWSQTSLWVQALKRGAAPTIRTAQPQRFAIEGAQGRVAMSIRATTNSITLDKEEFWGSRKSYIFDPATERYESVSNLNLARWYPSLVRLINGKVLAVSGLDQFGRIIIGHNEEWDPRTRSWSVIPKLTRSFPTYPALFLMPTGNLFFTGANAGFGPLDPNWRNPGIWNPDTNAFKSVLGMRNPNMTETAGSVLLPPAQDQRYAIIGGGGVGDSNRGTGRIDVVDLKRSAPRWQPAGALPEPTRYPGAVITPNDKVIIAGGSRGYRGAHASDILECHLYDPRTGKLTSLANPSVGRDYHSEALLLPDGRILTLGGDPLYHDKLDTANGYFEQRIEIYTPPYLYNGPRPRLTAGPQQLTRGGTAVFTTPRAAEIASARLMRPSAATHVTDLEQRSIALGVRRTASAVALTVPSSAGLVPPGWYMLFVTNRQGSPSIARWVHVG